MFRFSFNPAQTSLKNKSVRLMAVVSIALLLQSCSATRNLLTNSGQTEIAKLAPGSLLINRPAPKIDIAKLDTAQSNIDGFGFTPIKGTSLGMPAVNSSLVSVSLSRKQLTVNKAGTVRNFEIASNKDFVPGAYKILLIQEKPTWYAEDEYFSKRELSCPKPNSKARFLKGVLGPKAIYLSKDITLHSSNFLADDAKGLKLSANDIEELSGLLSSGDVIQVAE